jgi:hypothetical protein
MDRDVRPRTPLRRAIDDKDTTPRRCRAQDRQEATTMTTAPRLAFKEVVFSAALIAAAVTVVAAAVSTIVI